MENASAPKPTRPDVQAIIGSSFVRTVLVGLLFASTSCAQSRDSDGESVPFPCTDAVPASSGLEYCEAGYHRRVGAATCWQKARMHAVQANNPGMDTCTSDRDCADVPHGFCGKREEGNALECIAGCMSDADCDEGRVCFCGLPTDEPFGRCVPASCDSSADCEPGYECVATQSVRGCPSTRFECQTPSDSCASDVDCYAYSPNPAFCVWRADHFSCDITQCTGP